MGPSGGGLFYMKLLLFLATMQFLGQEGTLWFHRKTVAIRNNNLFPLGENVLSFLMCIWEFKCRSFSEEAHLCSVSCLPDVGAQQAFCELPFSSVDVLENGENAATCVFLCYICRGSDLLIGRLHTCFF